MKARLIPLCALLAATTLAGCGQDNGAATSPGGAAQGGPTAGSASATQETPSGRASPSAPQPLDDAGPTPAPIQSARPDHSSAAQARARATAFLRAFARTDLAQSIWWKGVEGYFTPSASAVYRSTDVHNVPVRRVKEGSARLLPVTTKYRAEVAVGTDVGTYTVILIRAESDWLVDRAVPPK